MIYYPKYQMTFIAIIESDDKLNWHNTQLTHYKSEVGFCAVDYL